MSAPQVSVLMPSFNHERFVLEAVHSVLACRAVTLELIVIDDGSRDQTVSRLRQIDDPRMILEVGDNRGAHTAFNRAFELARGELVALINSDDAFAQDRIERLVGVLSNSETVAAASWLELIDDQGNNLGVKHAWHDMPPWPPARGPRLSELGDPGLALLESNWIATTSNIAFRRSAAGELRFRPLRYCHDWDFFLGLARLGPMAVIADPCVKYRIHDHNTLREGRAQGQAQMQLEILWLLVAPCPAHAHRPAATGAVARAILDRAAELRSP